VIKDKSSQSSSNELDELNERTPGSSQPRLVFGLLIDASGTLLKSHPLNVNEIEIYSDATNLLRACKSRRLGKIPIRTAIVTNWGRKVELVLTKLGIAECFDVVTCADDVIFAKPHSEIFHRAAALLDVQPQHCFHIGDSLADDALGAEAAGMGAVWLNRNPSGLESLQTPGFGGKFPNSVAKSLDQAIECAERYFHKHFR
jgi:putative hydrolase of the HAD superfamily